MTVNRGSNVYIVASLRRGVQLNEIPGAGNTLALRLEDVYDITIADDLPTGRRAIISVCQAELDQLKKELSNKCHFEAHVAGHTC